MHISVLGGVKAGKDTVAAGILTVLAMVRRELDGQDSGVGAPGWALGIATERTSAMPLGAWNLRLQRCRNLGGTQRAIQSAAGGSAVLSTATALYEEALESWRKQANAYRELQGLPPQAHLTPALWAIINQRYRASITEQADRSRVDLVEVHRTGVAGYVLHPDYGLREGEGIRPRGQSESGSQADFVLNVEGGLRTRHRPSLDRGVTVVSDPSGKVVGESRDLPDLRDPKDFVELTSTLYRLLAPSLLEIIPRADAEREEWVTVLDEEPDDWPEARENAEAGEAARHIDTVKLILMRQGVDGMTSEARSVRAEALIHAFGVADVGLLPDVPVGKLRSGLPELDRYLTEQTEQRHAVAVQVAAVKQTFARHGVESKAAVARATKERALLEIFRVEDADKLSTLSPAALEQGAAKLPEFLEGQGFPPLEEGPL